MTSSLPWWQTAVIYQIYPRSFLDTNADGIGDIPGITARLDYLAGVLGIDAIWISPFYTSPMADFGYDVADYCDVDPIFGTLDDFDTLLTRAHQLGLRVLVDFVPNHSSDQHPWFMESSSSRDNSKRDWYVWRDPAPDGGPPNNWLSVFGGSAWQWHEITQQYYLHSFLKEQPDLNWRHTDVRKAMMDQMTFWLDRGVDGFRIDVAHFLMKDPEERSNPPAALGEAPAHKSFGEYDSQIHVHDKGHHDIHWVHRDIRKLVDDHDSSRERVTIGELHEFEWKSWARYYGGGNELNMPFNFALLKADWSAAGIRDSVLGLEKAIPPFAWPNYVLGNHDETRLATRLGPEHGRLAAMLLLTLRGTPTLYYGDEIGMLEAPISPDEQQDPWGLRVPGLGRDGCRTPMQWDDSAHAGFSTAPPWLPVSTDYSSRNVEAALADPESLLNLYRRLLKLRRAHAALSDGSFREVDGGSADAFCYVREAAETELFVALNFSDDYTTVQLPSSGRVLCWTHASATSDETVDIVFLGPRAGMIAVLYPDAG